MDLINEFGFILSQSESTELDLLLPPQSKIRLLFDLVTIQHVNSDDEAAAIIYNSTKADKKYSLLKRNLVQKLSEYIFLQDGSEEDEQNYLSIQFRIEKELNIAEKLLSKNVYHNPTKIITKVEHTAGKYFLIDLQVAAARKFRTVYALKGYSNETRLYDDKLKELSRFQNYLYEACGMWEILYSKTKYSIAKTSEIFNKCEKYSLAVENFIKDYPSPFLKLYLYRINLLMYSQGRLHTETSDTLAKIKKLVKQYPFIKSKLLSIEINYQEALNYRTLNIFSKAEKSLNKCLRLADYRAFDKFLLQELNFDLCIKNEDYLKAVNLLNEIHGVVQFQILDPYDKAAWAIREGYLYFILQVKQQTDLIKQLPTFGSDFSIKIFLQKSKRISKDKLGYHIMLLIIRVLLSKTEQGSKPVDAGRSLCNYYTKYMQEFNNQRTGIFTKHLANIAVNNFNLTDASTYKAKMLLEFAEIGEQSFDMIELVPYERLWEMMFIQKAD